jgi:hypothetical protein
MAGRTLLSVFAWLLLSGIVLAASVDCPPDHANLEKLVADAPSCDASMKLLLACQLGSSGDVSPATIVIKKCEDEFLASSSKRARRTYDRKVAACGREFANDSGTLFQSIRAICAAEVAHTYASHAAKRRKP